MKKIYGNNSNIVNVLLSKDADNLFYNRNISDDSFVSETSKLYPRFTVIKSEIHDYTYISQNSVIKHTKIGKFCSIGPNFLCGWGIHPLKGVSTSPMFYSQEKQNGYTLSRENKIDEYLSIQIGNDVFIGMNVTVLDGVKIGDGAVIGAGSIVSKDIPPYAIAVGNPIRIIRYRIEEQKIQDMLHIAWWNWDIEKLQEVETYFFEIDQFIEKHKITSLK